MLLRQVGRGPRYFTASRNRNQVVAAVYDRRIRWRNGPAAVIDRRYRIPVKYAGEPAVKWFSVNLCNWTRFAIERVVNFPAAARSGLRPAEVASSTQAGHRALPERDRLQALDG